MNARHTLAALASLAGGAALIVLLVAVSGIHWKDLLSQLGTMDKLAWLGLMGLLVVNTLLASVKWRLTDEAMRQSSDGSPSPFESFALTSMGTALGQILPVQLSMPVVRALGTRIHGRPLQRGALGTLFEQSFDFLFVAFLMLASLVTCLLRGRAKMWFAMAAPGAALAILGAGYILGIAKKLTAHVASKGDHPRRWRQLVGELSRSAVLNPELGRKLMFLSALRFTVLVFMAGRTTAAIHAQVPLWRLGVAMPFAVLATGIGITPGGLGIAEFSYVGVLMSLGTPLSVATQWALVNRLLIAASSVTIALVLLPFFFARRAARQTVGSESRLRRETPVES